MLEIKVRTEEDGSRTTEFSCEGETEDVMIDTVYAAATVIDYMIRGDYLQASMLETVEDFCKDLQNVLNEEAERRQEGEK
ncbi:MAG: hypothetical protein IJ573_00625 [Clostridia bacterium]|nr:hypothetical protein [Clostridia bacterium]